MQASIGIKVAHYPFETWPNNHQVLNVNSHVRVCVCLWLTANGSPKRLSQVQTDTPTNLAQPTMWQGHVHPIRSENRSAVYSAQSRAPARSTTASSAWCCRCRRSQNSTFSVVLASSLHHLKLVRQLQYIHRIMATKKDNGRTMTRVGDVQMSKISSAAKTTVRGRQR